MRPVIADSGRDLVASIDGATETALEAVLGLLEVPERDRLTRIIEHARGAVWNYGTAPVVAVLEVE